jgi:hypothetical protein
MTSLNKTLIALADVLTSRKDKALWYFAGGIRKREEICARIDPRKPSRAEPDVNHWASHGGPLRYLHAHGQFIEPVTLDWNHDWFSARGIAVQGTFLESPPGLAEALATVTGSYREPVTPCLSVPACPDLPDLRSGTSVPSVQIKKPDPDQGMSRELGADVAGSAQAVLQRLRAVDPEGFERWGNQFTSSIMNHPDEAARLVTRIEQGVKRTGEERIKHPMSVFRRHAQLKGWVR